MKIKSADFITSAPDLRSCPPSNRPEFAFIGRSNVGKSSLINLLVKRRELAKVSATPGKTRLINFFLVNQAWCLVDLPGYGYAEGAKTERWQFNKAVADYLEHRENLVCVFVLIDSRLPPQKIDLEFLRWLAGVDLPFAIVFTKIDKNSATKTRTNAETFQQALAQVGVPPPAATFLSSATKGDGRDHILGYIGRTIAGGPDHAETDEADAGQEEATATATDSGDDAGAPPSPAGTDTPERPPV